MMMPLQGEICLVLRQRFKRSSKDKKKTHLSFEWACLALLLFIIICCYIRAESIVLTLVLSRNLLSAYIFVCLVEKKLLLVGLYLFCVKNVINFIPQALQIQCFSSPPPHDVGTFAHSTVLCFR